MPSELDIRTQPTTRDQLAQIFDSPRAIRLMESLLRDTATTIPEGVMAAQSAAEAAQVAAEAAADAAEAARVAADTAREVADAAALMVSDLLQTAQATTLREEVAQLVRRIGALEQGSTA